MLEAKVSEPSLSPTSSCSSAEQRDEAFAALCFVLGVYSIYDNLNILKNTRNKLSWLIG